MNLFHALILGVIQGLTEFIPVSSAAHIILVPWLFNWGPVDPILVIALHIGTFTSLFFYFFRDWFIILKGGLQSIVERKIGFDRERLLFWLIIVGTIPTAVGYWLFHDNDQTKSPLIIAITLSFVGFLMYWIDGKYTALKPLDELRMGDAFMIGLAQTFGVIPGVSRTAASMLTGRLRGVNRESAARFAFLLSFPIILANAILDCRTLFEQPVVVNYPLAAMGFVVSFLFGLIGIHFTLRFLRLGDLAMFAWYRIGLAILIVLWSLLVRTT